MRARTTTVTVVLIIVIASGIFGLKREETSKASSLSTQNTATQKANTKDTRGSSGFNKSQYSLTDPSSLWVIVNKQRALTPHTYVPELVVPSIQLRSNITSDERQVRPVVADALKSLTDEAKADGVTFTLESGYRSYQFQVNLYNHYVSVQGKAVADSQSARPGYSEHQTGLAADLGGVTKPACNVEDCYKSTPEGQWLAANAYKYGFIIRYPEGKQAVTGYIYEPWHLRFVGTNLSTEMHASGASTMEEFFGLPAAADYN